MPRLPTSTCCPARNNRGDRMAQRVGELVLTHRPWNERRSCLGGSSGVSVQRLRPVRDLRAPISKRRLTHDDLELGWHGTALVARWPSALLSEWGAARGGRLYHCSRVCGDVASNLVQRQFRPPCVSSELRCCTRWPAFRDDHLGQRRAAGHGRHELAGGIAAATREALGAGTLPRLMDGARQRVGAVAGPPSCNVPASAPPPSRKKTAVKKPGSWMSRAANSSEIPTDPASAPAGVPNGFSGGMR
jgi:hypothetical protein